jgi:hypothetical protein
MEEDTMKKAAFAVAAICLSASLAEAAKESPFACNRDALSPAERKRHFDELGPALYKLGIGVHELPDGYDFQFPNDASTYKLLTEWVYQETLCCPFFDIAVRLDREGGPLWMRLTGRPGTKEFIKADFGRWMTK